MRLLQEQNNSQTSLYVYEDEGYNPWPASTVPAPMQKIRYYHNDLNGLPEQLTETDGHTLWQALIGYGATPWKRCVSLITLRSRT